MAGNSFGELFRITTFGESHGEANGVIIDGIEPGFPLDLDALQREMDRRKPGQSAVTTPRKERDRIRILSGFFEGRTTGAPLTLMLFNENQQSRDYDSLRDVYRPGHGDYPYAAKYGHRDYRGGGRASGRETSARVAAGAVAKQLLQNRGITVTAYSLMIGGLWCSTVDLSVIETNPVRCPDREKAPEMEQIILDAGASGDSVGGIVECICRGVPSGLGDPVFDKLDGLLAHGMLSIGAVKGIEFGAGFGSASLKGSQFNDAMTGPGAFASNHAGGTLSGISTGQDIQFRLPVRPTPSISRTQQTVDIRGGAAEISIEGRHDPCIIPRIIPVVESMAVLVLIDRWYQQFGRDCRQPSKG